MTPEPPPQPEPRPLSEKVAAGVLVALLLPCLLAAGAGAWMGLARALRPVPVAGGDPTSEARVNVLKLCGDVQAYRDTRGAWLLAGPTPREVPQGHAVPWPEDARFHALGFEPGATVRYQYEVLVQEDPVGALEVTCVARGDLDGDGQHSVFRVTLDAQGMTSAVEAEREEE